ncbi:MAG: hypothetical protein BYD32DRAFT_425359, partial [Podila humilis]
MKCTYLSRVTVSVQQFLTAAKSFVFSYITMSSDEVSLCMWTKGALHPPNSTLL